MDIHAITRFFCYDDATRLTCPHWTPEDKNRLTLEKVASINPKAVTIGQDGLTLYPEPYSDLSEKLLTILDTVRGLVLLHQHCPEELKAFFRNAHCAGSGCALQAEWQRKSHLRGLVCKGFYRAGVFGRACVADAKQHFFGY
jgi:hypothetical protein